MDYNGNYKLNRGRVHSNESANDMISLNGKPITPTLFPDGTSQVWKLELPKAQYVKVEWKFSHEGEIMHLAQLKLLLDSHLYNVHLHIPFLPYARQDKPITNSTTFALHALARILNGLNFWRISCIDPHSGVARDQIVNLWPDYPVRELEEVYEMVKPTCVCFPDVGSEERYRELYAVPVRVLIAEKMRDPVTGNILKHALTFNEPVNAERVLIIDDICDGGATFVSMAKMLFDKGAMSVDLFVSHGIFSRGLGPLKEAGIGRIFTKEGEVSKGWDIQPDSITIKPYQGV